jgi:signal transduction histidine kinase
VIERIQKTFPVFEITIVAALLLIGWTAFRLYEIVPGVREDRAQVIRLKSEYDEIGKYVRISVAELHTALTNYLQGNDVQEIKHFQSRGQEMSEWIARKKALWVENQFEAHISGPGVPAVSMNTNGPLRFQTPMGPLLEQIGQATTNYLKACRYLLQNAKQPLIETRREVKLQAAQRARGRLLNLSLQADLRGEMLQLALAGSQRRLVALEDSFQHLRWAFLLTIVAICFLLMLAIYRSRVAQTHAVLIEQQSEHQKQEVTMDKLTHFGQLAQELAHEIKQPLTAISARAYTLQKTLPAGSEEYKDAVVIRNEIKRLDKTVKDFLELAKPAEPMLEPVTAEETVREIRDLMALQLQEESVEFKYEFDEDLSFMADPLQLKQVLINLVRNAAESLDHPGTVTLRAHSARRELKGEETDAAIIEVQDNGAGIPPEIQKKIFDPFFSTKQDGTGLGLAISGRIIEKHGGTLEFESEPEKGTIFRIVLPACKNEQPHEQGIADRG